MTARDRLVALGRLDEVVDDLNSELVLSDLKRIELSVERLINWRDRILSALRILNGTAS